jgi:hypothetical protein
MDKLFKEAKESIFVWSMNKIDFHRKSAHVMGTILWETRSALNLVYIVFRQIKM